MTHTEIEQRSLSLALWANLLMAVLGIVFSVLSNASALLLDGLFSGVNFLAILFAARVASTIRLQPDSKRPFGYEIDEPVYIMFRSLVLTGIIIMALLGAVQKIGIFATGGVIEPIIMGPIIYYIALMVFLCFGLAAYHHKNWVRTSKTSNLLKAEQSAVFIDGVLSAAAGLAFLMIALLKKTPLSGIVPVSDSIIVILLSIFMLPQPIKFFMQALREIMGEGVSPEKRETISNVIQEVLTDTSFDLLSISATQTGRTLFILANIKPAQACSAEEMDQLRDELFSACSDEFGSIHGEVIFTARKN